MYWKHWKHWADLFSMPLPWIAFGYEPTNHFSCALRQALDEYNPILQSSAGKSKPQWKWNSSQLREHREWLRCKYTKYKLGFSLHYFFVVLVNISRLLTHLTATNQQSSRYLQTGYAALDTATTTTKPVCITGYIFGKCNFICIGLKRHITHSVVRNVFLNVSLTHNVQYMVSFHQKGRCAGSAICGTLWSW